MKSNRPSTTSTLCLLTVLLTTHIYAGGASLNTEVILKKLPSPWALALLPDQQVLITSKQGDVLLADLNSQKIRILPGSPESSVRGQGGLMDIELHPDFATNKLLFLTYTLKTQRGYSTALARARLDEHMLADTETIFIAEAFGSGGRHFGSRLAFDDRGFLYMSIGDRGERDYSQDLMQHNGKIVRLNDDGSVPKDNPFTGQPNVLPEIYSYGHRNPQGMVFDMETKRLWIHEHGPRGGDELNLVLPAKNYGWPLVSHGREYYGLAISDSPELAGTESPVFHWTPSIAPSGMAIYQGDLFKEWQGDFLVGALKFQLVTRVIMQDTKAMAEERMLERGSRIRDVKVGDEGAVYVLTDGDNAELWRVTPAS